MKEPFILLISFSCMIHVQICAGRYHVPFMPGSLSGQDWPRNPGYNCHSGGAEFQHFSSCPYSSTRYDHEFKYQHNICCHDNPGIPSGFDHAFGMPPWPPNPASKSPWSWQYASDPCWLQQYYGFSTSPESFATRPGYGTGPLDNGWKDYGSCSDKIHTAISNCKAEEIESCRKHMATLEQKLRAQYTKVIEEKCSNQSSQPQHGNDCEESYRKEKAALEERLQAQCATSQSNAATKCKSEKYTMSEDHRKANKQLEEENERLRKENDKLAQKAKNDQKAKEKLERDNEELEQENKRLKKQDSECAQKAKDDQKAKEELEQENDGLKKEKEKNAQKGKGEQKSKEELEQENDRLKKQEEERAQKAKDDQKAKEDLEQENAKLKKQEEEQAQKAKENQKAKEELEKENDRLKAESRPNQQPNKIASQPNSSESELEAFSKKGCPSLHGERATVLGVTYEAFCGARPRGRHTGDYVNSRNLADCMGACTVDRSCQGVYYETSLGRCQTTMDWEYPPLRWADSGEFSLVPVAPREGGIGTTTPDLPSLLIKDEHKDGASCPDSDGMIVSVGSLQFRVNCRKYQPKKHIEKTGSSGRVSGMLAICALNPACQGVSYWASSVYMIAEHEKLPERTKNSDLVKDYEWVIMLIEPRVAI